MLHDLNDSSPHSVVQREAIAAGVQLLHDEGRARARFTMACGTGKTFTQIKLVEALLAAVSPGPRRILVLVPTLALVRQSRDEWAQAQALGEAYASLCVCSDPSLKAGVLQDHGEDHVELMAEELAELGVPLDTNAHSDIQRINAWLDQREQRTALAGGRAAVSVIFSTYQSAPVVGLALAARAAGDRGIDIGVFDEAHKTAGAAGKPFAWALADENIEIGKRLFFTATERIVATAKRGQASEEGEIDIISMDDEAVYGPRAYNLPFSQAVERGIIVPYEIIISVVGDPFLRGEKLAQRRVRSAEGEHHSAIDIANMTALQRVMEKFHLRKAITFHRTVARAKGFAGLRHTVEGARMDGSNGFNRLHVSGRQTHAQRREQLRQYAEGMGRQIITNARCLTEGINVPATDLVAFMDSRGSTVDIVQAAGRTMRRAPGKAKGYIFLPVHDIEQDFGRVRDVLAAMAENDEALMEEMGRVATAAVGQGGGDGDACQGEATLERLPIQILTDGHGGEVRAEQLAQAIRVRLVQAARKLVGSFDVYFAALVAFKAEHGHCNVPYGYVTSNGLALGKWLVQQRFIVRKPGCPQGRRERLEALGVAWDIRDKEWEKNFAALQIYKKEHGNCHVIDNYIDAEGRNLGRWLFKQRQLRKGGKLREDRNVRLEKLGVIWNPLDFLWEQNFDALRAFRATHGHCNVPQSHVSADGLKLGVWVSTQRKLAKKPDYPQDRRARLEALGIIWNRLDSFWEQNFDALRVFRATHGHCNVPQSHVSADGLKLGTWLNAQRQLAKKHGYPQERRARLEKLGIAWRIDNSSWGYHFVALQEFKGKNQHCDVPVSYVNGDGLKLGRWVFSQRQEAKKIGYPEERRLLLDGLGFSWMLRIIERVDEEKCFAALEMFKEERGHCNVPARYVTPGGLKLGQWLRGLKRQLAKESSVDESNRASRLKTLGVVWSVQDAAWDENFSALQAFKSEHGHCDVPGNYVTSGGMGLGSWLSAQRVKANKPSYPQVRRERLSTLGVIWSVNEAAWERWFAALMVFKGVHGYSDVPQSHVTADGLRLGGWLHSQRQAAKRVDYPQERRVRLEALGVQLPKPDAGQ